MSAIELKKMLIHRLAEIDDVSFLQAIKTILDTKAPARTIRFTAEQRLEIEESMKEIEQGHYLEQVELDKKFDKWLSAR